MPFTYLSHQAPAVGLKLWRPAWFDGTALVFGSMAPDFAYAFAGTALAFNAHEPLAAILFCVPVTLAICALVRRRVAKVAFAQMPNTSLRLHDYRVLSGRRPPVTTTALSAIVGAATHVVWDTFTHDGRWAFHTSDFSTSTWQRLPVVSSVSLECCNTAVTSWAR